MREENILMQIHEIIKDLNVSAEVTELYRKHDDFTEYLLDNKYILRISGAELPEQGKHYRVHSVSFVPEIYSSGVLPVSGCKYYYKIFDYVQGVDLFSVIQNLTDKQKYNIGKEIAQCLSELHAITDGYYDMGHYIPVIPRYKGFWKDGHLEYAKLLKSGLAEIDLELNSKKIISAAFDYIHAHIGCLNIRREPYYCIMICTLKI